jgi:sulfur carrier protein
MPQQRPIPQDRILVNGDEQRLPADSTLRGLLEELGLAGKRVAVALNREVVPRSGYAATALCAGDRVEILEAVGGG